MYLTIALVFIAGWTATFRVRALSERFASRWRDAPAEGGALENVGVGAFRATAVAAPREGMPERVFRALWAGNTLAVVLAASSAWRCVAAINELRALPVRRALNHFEEHRAWAAREALSVQALGCVALFVAALVFERWLFSKAARRRSLVWFDGDPTV